MAVNNRHIGSARQPKGDALQQRNREAVVSGVSIHHSDAHFFGIEQGLPPVGIVTSLIFVTFIPLEGCH